MEAAGSSGASGAGATKFQKGPRACTTCARAKIRCISGPAGQDKCERCHRLRKPCSSQTPAPPRKRKQPRPTRVAELERRLEDLTARVESAQRLAPVVPSPPDSGHCTASPIPTPTSENRLPSTTLSRTHIVPTACGRASFFESQFEHLFPKGSIFDVHPAQSQQPTDNGDQVGATHGSVSPPEPAAHTPASTTTTNSSYQDAFPQAQQKQDEVCPWPEGDEAEALLIEYKTYMGHLFPFAVVPPDLSSAQFRKQKPLFWKAVMMRACLFDGERQDALGNALLKEISEAAFLRPQKDLDLLQGLQLLIACYNYNLNSFQMANLLFLARSVTTSLGSVEAKSLPDKQVYSSESLEQMRAFAGTYYLVTLTFTTNKRLDALMNTSYLTTCCRGLHSQMEYPTDEFVVHLVRAQQLSQSILQASARRNAMPREKQTSQAAFIQSLRDRIQGFIASLPPHVRVNQSLIGHLHVAEVLIYDNNLRELFHNPFASRFGVQDSTGQIPAPVTGISSERLELLWACVRALQAFTASRFGLEMGEYPRLICPSSFELTYVLITMFKLISLKIPNWDVERVRQELQFDECISRLIKMMENAIERRKKRRSRSAADGQEGNETEDTYTKVARKMRNVKDHLLANIQVLCSSYTTSIARVCDPAPMTLTDATQDLLQDLGSGMWQDAMTGSLEWDAFLVGDGIDWSGTWNNNYMAEPGHGA